jgi:hypothetical protein
MSMFVQFDDIDGEIWVINAAHISYIRTKAMDVDDRRGQHGVKIVMHGVNETIINTVVDDDNMGKLMLGDPDEES